MSRRSGADAFLQIILDYGVRIKRIEQRCCSRLPSHPADSDLRCSIQLNVLHILLPWAATVSVADAMPAPGRATPILPGPGWAPGRPGAAETRSDADLSENLPAALQVLSTFHGAVRPCCNEGSVSAPCRRGPEQKARAVARRGAPAEHNTSK